MSRNEITGDEQRTRAASPEYLHNHAKIFGESKIQRGRWVQHPETGKLVPAHEYQRRDSKADFILMDRWDPYESEVSGKIIKNRRERDYDLKSSGCRPYEGKDTEVQRANSENAERVRKGKAERLETMEKTYYEIEHGYRRVE